jgi:hypothetical protein
MPLYQPPTIPGLTVSGGVVTIATESTGNLLVLESTTDGGTTDANPELVFKSASDDAGDYIGSILFDAKNAGGTYDTYAQIFSRVDTATEAQTAGGLFFQVKHQNANTTMLWMEGHPTGTGTFTVNYNAQDVQTSIFTGNSRFNVYQDGTVKTLNSGFRLFQRSNAADMDGTGISLDFMLRETTGSSDKTAGRIGIIAEQDWTSTASTQDAAMVFYTMADGSSAERMRITSAGNLQLQNGNSITWPSGSFVLTNADGTDLTVKAADDLILHSIDDMFFKTSGSFKMTLLDGGNLGIGTTAPSSLLEVQGGLTTVGAVLTLSTKETTVVANDVLGRINFRAPLEASGTDAILPGASIHALASDTFAADNNETDLVFSTASSDAEGTAGGGLNEIMRITSGGKVGIGTTAPAAPLHIVHSGTEDSIRLESTDAGTALGPDLVFKRTTATPVNGDLIGSIRFLSMNSDQDDGAGTEAEHEFADIYARVNDITLNSESGELYFRTFMSGTQRSRIAMTLIDTVINEDAQDLNFRVEGVGAVNALFVQGSDGKVGIGTATPGKHLEVNAATSPTIRIREGSEGGYLDLVGLADSQSQIHHTNTSASENAMLDLDVTAVDGQSQNFRFFRNSNASATGFIQVLEPGTSTVKMIIAADTGKTAFGTGTVDANAMVTVEGAISLDEISAPTNTADRGQLYTNADNELHMVDGAGVDAIFLKGGKHSIWVPATAMRATTTAGCSALTAVETTAGRPDMVVLDFATGSTEFAQFNIAMPGDYAHGTAITFQVYWAGIAATTGVSWALSAVAIPNNSTIDVTFASPVQLVDDAQGAVEELNISAESGNVTVKNAAAGALTYFQFSRDHDESDDDMNGDARLLGIKIFYTVDKGNEA